MAILSLLLVSLALSDFKRYFVWANLVFYVAVRWSFLITYAQIMRSCNFDFDEKDLICNCDVVVLIWWFITVSPNFVLIVVSSQMMMHAINYSWKSFVNSELGWIYWRLWTLCSDMSKFDNVKIWASSISSVFRLQIYARWIFYHHIVTSLSLKMQLIHCDNRNWSKKPDKDFIKWRTNNLKSGR